jgi:hypothetical protein
LVDVYQSAPRAGVGELDPDVLRHGIEALLAVAFCRHMECGPLGRAIPRPAESETRLRTTSTVALVLCTAIAGGALIAAVKDPVGRVEAQYEAFIHLSPGDRRSTGSNRFTSGAGNRYDYWRIAVHQFEDHPAPGIGAGNYDRTYYLERRTDENVRQPHSLLLQTFGEIGLVGAVGLALFVVGIIMGFARRARRSGRDPTSRLVAVTGGGMFFAWFVHTSIDWLHAIPGVTAMALAGAATLVCRWRSRPSTPVGERRERRFMPRPRLRAAVVVLSGVAILFGAVEVGRLTLANHYRSRAQDLVSSDPRAAVREADKSLSLNEDVSAY